MDIGGRKSAAAVDRPQRRLPGHDMARKGVHAHRLSRDAHDGLVGAAAAAIEDVFMGPAQPRLVKRQHRQHSQGPTATLPADAISSARPAAGAISLSTGRRACMQPQALTAATHRLWSGRACSASPSQHPCA